MIPLRVLGIRVQPPTNQPVVVLEALDDSRRAFDIMIGVPEANAITFALEGIETPRPLTHDLLVNLVYQMGFAIQELTIVDLIDGTFFGELTLGSDSEEHRVSCRPSDGIAIALRCDAPIYIDQGLLDRLEVYEIVDEDPEQDAQGDSPVPAEEMLSQFRDFIDQVSPEDFAS